MHVPYPATILCPDGTEPAAKASTENRCQLGPDRQPNEPPCQSKRDIAGIFDQGADRSKAIIRPDRGRDESGAAALPPGPSGQLEPGAQDVQLSAAARPGRAIGRRRYADIRQGVGRVHGATFERSRIGREQGSVPFHLEREPTELAEQRYIEPDIRNVEVEEMALHQTHELLGGETPAG